MAGNSMLEYARSWKALFPPEPRDVLKGTHSPPVSPGEKECSATVFLLFTHTKREACTKRQGKQPR